MTQTKDLEMGYQMSLEQFQPDVALNHAVLAEQYGFESIWASDHFMPWYHTNATSAFAWSWLGAAAQATKKIKFGTGLTAPILRYNPGLVAQAFATLDYMFPGRIFLSLGTGEALNEMPLGYDWPPHSERLRRLEEAILVIRKLWTGDLISFKGNYYKLRKAKLYTPPRTKIPIFVAASGPKAAELAGRVGDGLLTITNPDDGYFKDLIFPAVERGLKSSVRDKESTFEKNVELQVSFDEDYKKAVQSVRPWAGNVMPIFFNLGVYDPRVVEEHGQFVGDENLAKIWVIATSSEPIIKSIERYAKLGFTGIHITSSSPSQEKFMQLYKKEILPALTS
ncbi:MAG: TIGR03557 family F420-dependent LLM class oxidoreductase [Thaumarchaeota archaeon]|nr:TIGR03557 family F420-dependent LLM class oxidoreductase [Nitrososphaerota archaeon]